jgi:siroheme synthase
MPGYQYGKISRKLRAAGLASDTPCAVVSRATTAEERVFTTDLENLPGAPQLSAPTLLVIGEVVRHAAHNTLLNQSMLEPAISRNFNFLQPDFPVGPVHLLIDEGRTA